MVWPNASAPLQTRRGVKADTAVQPEATRTRLSLPPDLLLARTTASTGQHPSCTHMCFSLAQQLGHFIILNAESGELPVDIL